MITALTLVIIAVACRLLPFLNPGLHLWNFVPMGAVALYAGSRLPRRWAWAVPVAAMVLSDVVIDSGRHRPILDPTRWTIYLTFAATTWIGPIANRPKLGRWSLPILSLSASTLFFVTSNLATWAEGRLYPVTLPGLVQCFDMAIPFFKNTILADLLGTALLFGLGPVVERAARRSARPQSAGASGELGMLDPDPAAHSAS